MLNSKLITTSGLCLALVILVSLAQARYLPTRSDESEVAVLKELIRNILNEARDHQLERQQLWTSRSARLMAQQNNKQPSRGQHSYSMDLSSMAEVNDENDNQLLFDSTALAKRHSAELVNSASGRIGSGGFISAHQQDKADR